MSENLSPSVNCNNAAPSQNEAATGEANENAITPAQLPDEPQTPTYQPFWMGDITADQMEAALPPSTLTVLPIRPQKGGKSGGRGAQSSWVVQDSTGFW